MDYEKMEKCEKAYKEKMLRYDREKEFYELSRNPSKRKAGRVVEGSKDNNKM